MRLKSSREGALFIDHRASPGLPGGFMKSIGLEGLNVGEGMVGETAFLTCCHCGSAFIKNPDRTRDRGHCYKCDDYICDSCVGQECTPFRKLLENEAEKAFRDETQALTTFSLKKGI